MTTLRVLLPVAARIEADVELRRWLAHGDRQAMLEHPRESMLRECFRFGDATLPVAALRHHCHAPDAAGGIWLCADPAWVQGDATGARLMACPVADLTMAEADALGEVLRPLFGDAGMPLDIDTPSEWCVRCPVGAPAVQCVAPRDALGANLLECLPDGQAGRVWRRLFNDAQVALHAHPVNAARTAAGKRPVNALWFWGRGTLPGAVAANVHVVASVDDTLRGLAKIASVQRVEPSAAAIDGAGQGDALLDLDTPAPLDAQWLPRFRVWLRKRRFRTIDVACADGARWRVRHVHRLRFWRRG